MARKISLKLVVSQVRKGGRKDLCRALHGLDGCPVGGWAETQQALRRIVDELPHREERTWLVDDLVDAVATVDHANRYRVTI